MNKASGKGTKDDPWKLKTPPGTSDYQMWRDDTAEPALSVVGEPEPDGSGAPIPHGSKPGALHHLRHDTPHRR